jgi:hypothetical protein
LLTRSRGALAEAKPATDGLHLGPVGGRIVAETLIGLLRAGLTSYLAVHPDFRPFLGANLLSGPLPTPTLQATALTPEPTSFTTPASSPPASTGSGANKRQRAVG